ncbi:MAG: sensor domain-containing diguanylate cyclase, partial [Armatimonadetes bacterium]|nr:sensor domain-containing diguanylate cyclase [Armatimonadota bacterium]
MVCNILICVLITLVLVFSYREAALRHQLLMALAQTAREAPIDERFHSIVENAVEGIFQSTLDGRYLHVNPALARLYGYETPQDLMNNLHNIAKDLYVDPNRRNEFQSLLQEQDFVRDFESQVYQKNGNLIWIVENARGVRDSQGTLLYYEGSVIDTTQRKHAEEQLVYQALHDSLTGLPNRLLFQERLHQAILRSTREQLGIAVLFVDLDDFKLINDSMGHEAGDTLLKTISERLQLAIRREDTIARIGGDEFIVLLERLNSVQEATHIPDRLVLELQNPIRLYEREVFTSASIGIA